MPESLFGAPYLCMHRGDLHEALAAAVPSATIHLDKKLVGLEPGSGQVALAFADGSRAHADAVIGADGVHSLVRDIIIGPDAPIHKGRIAYRADISRRRIAERPRPGALADPGNRWGIPTATS